jgi:hypothetical protein
VRQLPRDRSHQKGLMRDLPNGDPISWRGADAMHPPLSIQ